MKVEQFIRQCEAVKNAKSIGRAGEQKVFLSAVYVGYTTSAVAPPTNDDVALEGFKIGRKLRNNNGDN